MRSSRYLNTILTVLAILLTLNLVTSWTASGPTLADPASAQVRTSTAAPPTPPNAGQQRNDMIKKLDEVSGKLDQLMTLLRSGEARVRIENPPTNP